MNKVLLALLAAFALGMIPMTFGSDPAKWTAAHIAFGHVMVILVLTLVIGSIISSCSARKAQHRIHRSSR